MKLENDIQRRYRDDSDLGNPVFINIKGVKDKEFFPMRFDASTVHPNYLINKSSDIYAVYHKMIKTQDEHRRKGILTVKLTDPNPKIDKMQTIETHRVVAHTFLLPSGEKDRVKHIDKSLVNGFRNNHADNLSWVIPTSNTYNPISITAYSLKLTAKEWICLIHRFTNNIAEFDINSRCKYLIKCLQTTFNGEMAIEKYCKTYQEEERLIELYSSHLYG